jgi:hypothetical protein
MIQILFTMIKKYPIITHKRIIRKLGEKINGY